MVSHSPILQEPQLDSPMPVSSFIQLGNDEKIDAEVEEASNRAGNLGYLEIFMGKSGDFNFNLFSSSMLIATELDT